MALDDTPCDSGEVMVPKSVCASIPTKGIMATAKAIVIIFMADEHRGDGPIKNTHGLYHIPSDTHKTDANTK